MATRLFDREKCAVCGKEFSRASLTRLDELSSGLAEAVTADHPALSGEALICKDDLGIARHAYVSRLLEDEAGELDRLDQKVLASLATATPLTTQLPDPDEPMGFGDRMADKVATFGGSWTFILGFVAVLIVWMTLNVTGWLFKPFDVYPFILLNLALSCVAAIQAPIIMMSQRRQEVKDRQRAENDYMINLKSELEIRQLHDKIDHQIARQWQRLAEIQRIQIDMLEDKKR